LIPVVSKSTTNGLLLFASMVMSACNNKQADNFLA
jgi:hypothetical protein